MSVTPVGLLVSPRSANIKTGDVPTVWVGRTSSEARASCETAACPRLADGTCYAWTGNPVMAHRSVARRGADPVKALDDAARQAKMLRVGGIGDPAGANRVMLNRVLDKARSMGLAIVGYTHGWRDASRDFKGVFMASTESLMEADDARAAGWRVVVTVPPDYPETGGHTPNGARVVLCPAMRAGSPVTCNTCRLCDASRAGPVIAFREHGSTVARAAARRRDAAT